MHTLRKLIRPRKTPDPDVFHTGESLVPVRRSIDEGTRHLLPNGEALPLPGQAPKVTVTPRSPLAEDPPFNASDSLHIQLPEPAIASTRHAGLGTAALGGGNARRSRELERVPRGILPAAAAGYQGGLLAEEPESSYALSRPASYEPTAFAGGAAFASHSLRRSQDMDRPPPGVLLSADYHAGLLSRDPIADTRFSAPSNDYR